MDDNDVTHTAAREGGGISQRGSNAVSNITGSSVSDNTSSGDGGGIEIGAGRMSITDSDVTGNTIEDRDGDANVEGNGGGIWAQVATTAPPGLSITTSTISGNTAPLDGGGYYSDQGTDAQLLRVTRSTISGNTAGGNGGGLRMRSQGTLVNDTITNNTGGAAATVSGEGGGIYLRERTVSLYNVTVSHNVVDTALGDGIRRGAAGTFNLRNTIVAENDGDASNCSSGGTLATTILNTTNNLDSGTSCGFSTPPTNNSLSNANADLGSLQNNGGPTETRALGGSSAALNSASNTVCADATTVNNIDQRGVTRPQPTGGTCDIGAYEAEAVATIFVQKDFSDNNSANVNVTLDCGTATETTVDGTASESDSAEFTVTGFTTTTRVRRPKGAPAGIRRMSRTARVSIPSRRQSARS